jgi:hypothetical protein
MDDRGSNREKKRKSFDTRGQKGDILTGRVKAEKIKNRFARNPKVIEDFLAPFAKGKMF